MESQPKILVVDDEIGMREFLGAFLRAYDLPVVTAGSAEEALEVWEANRGQIRALITDIVMPGMNGKVLAECLRAKKPGLQVIFMSGFLPAEIAEDELDGTFFKKPFNPSELLSALGEKQ
jgi:DNA-binding NtrC family response regulator